MKKSTAMYAAGLFDGEGTVSLMRQHVTKRKSPVASLSSTTYELVEFMKTNFGGSIAKLSKREDHHKQAWHWQITHNGALDALRVISPYLLEPEKKRRATLLLSTYKKVTAANGKYTPEMDLARQAFENEFFGT